MVLNAQAAQALAASAPSASPDLARRLPFTALLAGNESSDEESTPPFPRGVGRQSDDVAAALAELNAHTAQQQLADAASAAGRLAASGKTPLKHFEQRIDWLQNPQLTDSRPDSGEKAPESGRLAIENKVPMVPASGPSVGPSVAARIKWLEMTAKQTDAKLARKDSKYQALRQENAQLREQMTKSTIVASPPPSRDDVRDVTGSSKMLSLAKLVRSFSVRCLKNALQANVSLGTLIVKLLRDHVDFRVFMSGLLSSLAGVLLTDAERRIAATSLVTRLVEQLRKKLGVLGAAVVAGVANQFRKQILARLGRLAQAAATPMIEAAERESAAKLEDRAAVAASTDPSAVLPSVCLSASLSTLQAPPAALGDAADEPAEPEPGSGGGNKSLLCVTSTEKSFTIVDDACVNPVLAKERCSSHEAYVGATADEADALADKYGVDAPAQNVLLMLAASGAQHNVMCGCTELEADALALTYGNDVFPARPSVCLLSHLDCAPSASLVAKSSVPLASTSLLRGVMHFLGMSQEEPTPLFVDNEGTVKIANWTASQKRSMYLVRRVDFLNELVGDVAIFPNTGPINHAAFET